MLNQRRGSTFSCHQLVQLFIAMQSKRRQDVVCYWACITCTHHQHTHTLQPALNTTNSNSAPFIRGREGGAATALATWEKYEYEMRVYLLQHTCMCKADGSQANSHIHNWNESQMKRRDVLYTYTQGVCMYSVYMCACNYAYVYEESHSQVQRYIT